MNEEMKVMLVDDNEIDLYLHEKMLSVAGISNDVTPFLSVKEAIRFLRSNARKPVLLPDLILLDIQMPGLNGFDFLDRFETLPQPVIDQVTIFMVSSTLDRGDLHRARRSPFVSRILRKPLNLKDLTTAVDYLLEERDEESMEGSD